MVAHPNVTSYDSSILDIPFENAAVTGKANGIKLGVKPQPTQTDLILSPADPACSRT